MTFISMATLVAAVLWRSSSDYRMTICVVVSVAAILLAIRSFSAGKIVWGLLFLGVLGVFTPFRSSTLPYSLASIFDMATLALFALSPLAFRSSVLTTVPKPSVGRRAVP
jgi:hypothetical protein